MSKWKEKLYLDPILFLLDSNPWTEYRTRLDLLELDSQSDQIIAAREKLVEYPMVSEITRELEDWFPFSITRHNDPKICYYRLEVLTDFGLDINHPTLKNVADKILEHRDVNGLFSVRQQLPQKGKFKPNPDADEWHALPCDSPLLTYLMVKMGVDYPEVGETVEIIRDRWKTDSEWFCHFPFVKGHYKKLNIGCPMAGLFALQLFSLVPELKESEFAKNAYAPIQYHKDYGKSLYYFGRGKKFWSLKYPFVWYNALYLANVLTRFEFLRGSELVQELVEWIEKSQLENGRFKPNSMFMNYKGWEFADKKNASPWITYLCCRILKQWYG